MKHYATLHGILCALGAGLVWGLVFVAPLILSEYPPAMLAFGRYLAFGLICLPLAWRDRRRLLQLRQEDWLEALGLSLVGNILYYLALSSAIQQCGGALPTLIIGTLPVVIAVVSNLFRSDLSWPRLLPSLTVIGAGIALVNHAEHADHSGSQAAYFWGIAAACAALACWTWYPIRNARWLKRNPDLSPSTWATAQGLTTLPLSVIGLFVYGFAAPDIFAFPLGPRPLAYGGLMLAIGLLASWLGTLLWNRASCLLPTTLVGQLIVFETLSALLYTFIWRNSLPGLPVACGIALLVGGVLIGVRTFQTHARQERT